MVEDFKEKWQKCLQIIRDNLGEERFKIYFSKTEATGLERDPETGRDTLTLKVPSHYFYEVYEDSLHSLLSSTLRHVFGEHVKLSYHVPVLSNIQGADVRLSSPGQSHAVGSRFIQSLQKPDAMAEQKTVSHADEFDPQLNPSLNFENYCIGDSNRLAYTIAEYISRNPKKKDFNPFFLFGPVGVGKTHLIQAIGIRIREQNPQAKVLFTTMRQFQHLYANAVIQKKIPGFINWFQQMDVLLIDDLQELSNKVKTSEALFPIFNHLHQSGKQLVFTCDRRPSELEGIPDRLIDRFKWGITEELPKPDLELRRKILYFKARKNGLDLPNEVLDIIAEKAKNSVRELEGVVMGILTRSITNNAPITVDMALDVMGNSIKMESKKPMNIEMIVEATADYYNLNPEVIFSKSRVRDVADARQVIMYLAKKLTGMSSTAIGFKLNRRHATVLHGISTVEDRMSVSKDLAETLKQIEAELLH